MKVVKLEDLQEIIRKNKEVGKNSYFEEKLVKEIELVNRIEERKEELYELQKQADSLWGKEDAVYRFYHESFKTYNIQEWTQKVSQLYCELGNVTWRDLNEKFKTIVSEGTYKKFDNNHNTRWLYETRPILEAFFHTKHMLDMMIKYGLESTPENRAGNMGWYTVLYLYKIR